MDRNLPPLGSLVPPAVAALRSFVQHPCRSHTYGSAPYGVQAAVRVVKATAVGAAVAGTAALSLSSPPSVPPSATGPDPVTAAVREVADAHGCSATGFEPGTVPASAIVRLPSGRVAAVGFDRGWAVHTGAADGMLVTVCLEDVRSLRRALRSSVPQGR